MNEDGVPTGIDVELATEAFRRMGYQVDIVQINWEKKKELVESGDAKTMPIIVMTANAFTEDRIRAKEAGMDEHISKPVDAKLLVEVIYKLVD
ncbi:response regulator [Clostridiaceae bacterium AF42-6]|nr:response regulator [Clostridiaceae bacterium AF42-6]RHQ23619.1 response regulator [Clostridiaceae bacterium AF29-16BH]